MTDLSRSIPPEEIEAAARSLVRARRTNLGVEVQLPVLYPTGDSVTVVVDHVGDNYLVHDASFGSMYLTNSGIKTTDKLTRRLQDLAKDFGCEYSEGRMFRRCSENQIAIAIALVANASKLIGDHVVSIKRQSIFDFKREVSSVAADIVGAERIRNDEEVIGQSGTLYKLNLVILDAARTRPIAYVETIAEKNSVNSRFRAFYDISKDDDLNKITRMSVYDDRHEWRSGDLILLQDVSKVVPFSNAKAGMNRLTV